jgi:hypothetical protein
LVKKSIIANPAVNTNMICQIYCIPLSQCRIPLK